MLWESTPSPVQPFYCTFLNDSQNVSLLTVIFESLLSVHCLSITAQMLCTSRKKFCRGIPLYNVRSFWSKSAVKGLSFLCCEHPYTHNRANVLLLLCLEMKVLVHSHELAFELLQHRKSSHRCSFLWKSKPVLMTEMRKMTLHTKHSNIPGWFYTPYTFSK